MRYDLVSHGNKRLGEVLLAEGVKLDEVGREFISGRPCRLVPVESKAAPAAAAGNGAAGGGGKDPKDKDPQK